MEGKIIEVLQGLTEKKLGDEVEVADRKTGLIVAVGKVVGFSTGAGGCIYLLVRVIAGG